MRTATDLLYKVKGVTFGARGCGGGCTCDPCDCDPCTCGDDEANIPRWRVSGYSIRKGEIRGCDISGLVLLNLALPIGEDENKTHAWRELLLVDSRANDEQVNLLLQAFEDELESMPAEIKAHEIRPRPVYRAALNYHWEGRPTLFVDCSPETMQLVRAGTTPLSAFTWSYHGPMALRSFF